MGLSINVTFERYVCKIIKIACELTKLPFVVVLMSGVH
jgi:hypothetical protein